MAKDFRSEPMGSPEGLGRARAAWEAYSKAVERVARPALEPVAKKVSLPIMLDLWGFWLVWQVNGGFEGFRRLGMSRSAIYRRVKMFRTMTGFHPDEYEMPGVSVDVEAHQSAPAPKGASS